MGEDLWSIGVFECDPRDGEYEDGPQPEDVATEADDEDGDR